MLEIIALALAAYLAGILTAHLYRRHKEFDAPVPPDLGYDPTNPINARAIPPRADEVLEDVRQWRIC